MGHASRYHKRSNVESAFPMTKREFGVLLRSETDTAMVNETLCKILCHNLVVLIHEMPDLELSRCFGQIVKCLYSSTDD